MHYTIILLIRQSLKPIANKEVFDVKVRVADLVEVQASMQSEKEKQSTANQVAKSSVSIDRTDSPTDNINLHQSRMQEAEGSSIQKDSKE